jgi:hypothetical protein
MALQLERKANTFFRNAIALQKKMSESILQAILANTTETRRQLDTVQDGLARIEVLTQQNSESINNLDRIVWKSVGDTPTLLQSYSDHNAKLQHLTYTVGKVEGDLRADITALGAKIDAKNQLVQTVILSTLMLLVGGGITFVVEKTVASK